MTTQEVMWRAATKEKTQAALCAAIDCAQEDGRPGAAGAAVLVGSPAWGRRYSFPVPVCPAWAAAAFAAAAARPPGETVVDRLVSTLLYFGQVWEEADPETRERWFAPLSMSAAALAAADVCSATRPLPPVFHGTLYRAPSSRLYKRGLAYRSTLSNPRPRRYDFSNPNGIATYVPVGRHSVVRHWAGGLCFHHNLKNNNLMQGLPFLVWVPDNLSATH